MHAILIIFFIQIILPQTWQLDTETSYIKYTGNHSFHSFEGISKNIDFSMNCNENDCNLNVASHLDEFDSGNDNRDSNMLYYTESLLYPIVSFTSSGFNFNNNFNSTISIEGTIEFHGIQKIIPINIKLYEDNENYWGLCQFNISLEMFEIEKPTLLMIPISDIIEIESKFRLIKESY